MLVRRDDVARELAQDIFIRLWQKGHTFPNEAMLFSWIYRACHNSGIDYLRSAVYRKESHTYEEEGDLRISHEDGSQVRVKRDLLRAVCAKVSERDAQIIAYLAFDDMTHDEVAMIMGISKKTVTRAIIHARSVLTVEEIQNV